MLSATNLHSDGLPAMYTEDFSVEVWGEMEMDCDCSPWDSSGILKLYECKTETQGYYEINLCRLSRNITTIWSVVSQRKESCF